MAKTEVFSVVDWPTAPLAEKLVLGALATPEFLANIDLVTARVAANPPKGNILQWSSYDTMDHALTLECPASVLSSSYAVRKSLIRKHFLARTIRSYVTKNPSSLLSTAVPQSWEIEINFADELDEMWTDELYDLGHFLDEDRWCILKPGMADRGMGLRLFNSKDDLQRIFEEFEDKDTDEEDESSSTAVVTSQLRHFVIQEYLPRPMLLDPVAGNNLTGRGHKVSCFMPSRLPTSM
jgi:tubulin--tyrosine ligase